MFLDFFSVHVENIIHLKTDYFSKFLKFHKRTFLLKKEKFICRNRRHRITIIYSCNANSNRSKSNFLFDKLSTRKFGIVYCLMQRYHRHFF